MIELPQNPSITTDFPEWDKLLAFQFSKWAGIKASKKLEAELYRAACNWLPYEPYGDASIKAPHGIYYFPFIVFLEQGIRWQIAEVVQGFEYGLTAERPRRASPYRDSYRKHMWECGYLWGLHIRPSL